MVSTAQAEAPPARAPVAKARKPPTPKALQERKLTVTSATEQYVTTTKAIEGLADLQRAAKEFLIESGRKTGRRTFLDQIAMVRTGGSNVVDHAAVADHYAKLELPLPRTKSKLGWSLKLLK